MANTLPTIGAPTAAVPVSVVDTVPGGVTVPGESEWLPPPPQALSASMAATLAASNDLCEEMFIEVKKELANEELTTGNSINLPSSM
jgi:hypothetical protein